MSSCAVAPGRDPDAAALETPPEDLALEQPEPVGGALDVRSAGPDERNRVDLDDGDVVAAAAQILERDDEPRIDERCQREDERGGREDSRGDDVDVAPGVRRCDAGLEQRLDQAVAL